MSLNLLALGSLKHQMRGWPKSVVFKVGSTLESSHGEELYKRTPLGPTPGKRLMGRPQPGICTLSRFPAGSIMQPGLKIPGMSHL